MITEVVLPGVQSYAVQHLLRFRVPLRPTPCLLRTRQSLLFICRPWSDVLEITEHLWSNFAVPPETGNGAGLSRRWMVQEPGSERLFDGHYFKLHCYAYGIYSYNLCLLRVIYIEIFMFLRDYFLFQIYRNLHNISFGFNLLPHFCYNNYPLLAVKFGSIFARKIDFTTLAEYNITKRQSLQPMKGKRQQEQIKL
ncbi:Hypothetical_protein [Hexamita inflata]|uniref:Hypothetical_protein n=1 Tax=Hexamita inflata TaxID=28002 RepID=A0AA86Q6U3_9EUKA|nr:Hypothetical protein HINF_LOCUS34735 [Hexamita inflata]